eukprot:4264959-Pyramimonas_sp.AAC.1
MAAAVGRLSGIGNTPQAPYGTELVIFVSISMVLGATFWAYTLGTLINIIASINISADEYQRHLDQLKHWMEYKKLPQKYREDTVRHFDYQWQRHHFVDEEALMAMLPHQTQVVAVTQTVQRRR